MGERYTIRTPVGEFFPRVASPGDGLPATDPAESHTVWFFFACQLEDREPSAMAMARALHERLGNWQERQRGSPDDRWAMDAIRHDLEGAVRRGQVVFERIAPMVARERRATAVPVVPPLPPPPPIPDPAKPEREETLTWFEVYLVDEIGEPLGGVDVVFARGSAETRLTTDGTGKARLDDVPDSFARVRLADESVVRGMLRERWKAAREQQWWEAPADVTCTEIVVRRHDPVPSCGLVAEEPHWIVLQPRVVLAQLFGMWFETSKCFLLPTALDGLRSVPTLYKQNRETDLVVVGHTDTAGTPSYNDPLSLERARSVVAYLRDEVDAWLDWYGSHQASEKRWGAREDALMISAVASYSGEDPPPDESLVHWFQRTYSDQYGLKVDDIAGPNTRRALVTEYMAIDGTSLPADVSVSAHGCGESFPLIDGGDGQAEVRNRRTEVFFFENPKAPPERPPAVLPPPPGDILDAGSREYPEWLLRARETHENEHGEPLPVGQLWIRFALSPDQAVTTRDQVRLFSARRDYDVSKDLSVSHVANDDTVDVPFDDVPTNGRYTLEIEPEDGEPYFVFQDLPYSTLNDDSLPEYDA
jgi:outer membrane protein OmpA-like peptidoglycan-associated protein